MRVENMKKRAKQKDKQMCENRKGCEPEDSQRCEPENSLPLHFSQRSYFHKPVFTSINIEGTPPRQQGRCVRKKTFCEAHFHSSVHIRLTIMVLLGFVCDMMQEEWRIIAPKQHIVETGLPPHPGPRQPSRRLRTKTTMEEDAKSGEADEKMMVQLPSPYGLCEDKRKKKCLPPQMDEGGGETKSARTQKAKVGKFWEKGI